MAPTLSKALANTTHASSLPAPEPIVLLLTEILGVQRQILAALEQRRPSLETTPTDLLVVLAASVADKAFSAREVIQHATLVDSPLRAALDAAGLVNPRQLGKALRTVEGHTIAGLQLVRIGLDRDGIVWRVLRV